MFRTLFRKKRAELDIWRENEGFSEVFIFFTCFPGLKLAPPPDCSSFFKNTDHVHRYQLSQGRAVG